MNIKVKVNGTEMEVQQNITIIELLRLLNIQTQALAVERNRIIVEQSSHATCKLEPGDELEIVTLVGGG